MIVLRKIVHCLSIICYIFIFIYAIICIPYIFKYKPLVVLTGSMEPSFQTGSIIYYKNVPSNEIKVGDIITFKMGNSLVSHRVYSINDGLYETKGDANNAVDSGKIKYSDIVGKDSNLSIPYLGYFVKYVNDHYLYIVISIGIILITEFILSNIGDIKSKKMRSIEENEQ